jgi:hypothetical protein
MMTVCPSILGDADEIIPRRSFTLRVERDERTRFGLRVQVAVNPALSWGRQETILTSWLGSCNQINAKRLHFMPPQSRQFFPFFHPPCVKK